MQSIETITKIRTWYNSIDRSFNDIEALVSAQRVLSNAMGDLGDDASEFAAEYENAHGERKIEYAKNYIIYSENYSGILAKEKATLKVQDLIRRETDFKNAKERLKNTLEMARNTLDVMSRHFKYLMAERARIPKTQAT